MTKRAKASPYKVVDTTFGKSFDHTTGKNFDPTVDKNYDSSTKVVLGPNGDVVSEVSKKRNELLDAMLTEIQNSLMIKMSGIGLSGKADNVGNTLYEMQVYGDSLRAAVAVVLQDFPTGDTADNTLSEMKELCEVLSEGVNRANYHLEEIKKFSEDVKNIQNEIYQRMTSIRFDMP